ncbi:MAG: CPBP family intramembrane metalloprotease [Deltaproteobacteria bacterium]|nr:CPBP family intramembrane metalloprotease [Deltaproteobacteria bacterium]
MNIGRNGTLIAAAIYVIAVGALISGSNASIDPTLATSLELRQFVFLARTVPIEDAPATNNPVENKQKKGKGDKAHQGDMSSLLVRPLEDLARRPMPSDLDRLRGAAVALAFNAPELVPLFVGPAADRDPIARLLVEWSFEPGRPVSQTELDWIRSSDLDEHLKDPVIVALADSSGLTQQAMAARQSANQRWSRTVTAGAALGLLAIAIMVIGSLLWFRTRTWAIRLEASSEANRPGPGDADMRQEDDPREFVRRWAEILPIIRVFVYFLAMFMTVGVLAPMLAGRDGVSLPTVAVLTYIVTGSFGLWLIKAVGRKSPDERWSTLVGLDGSFQRENLARAVVGALAAYCMIWPAMLGSSILSSGLFGDGGGIFENPMAVFLVTGSDRSTTVLMLLSVSVLAPMFEEPLFRGFLYGRLRQRMRPVPAAALSGLIFGAAHMSLVNMLPLAAIGFTLALAYEKSRDLATPMIAHGLWNLVEALMLLAVFT